MMMKYLGTMTLIVLCIGVLIAGQMHWTNKIEQASTVKATSTEKKSSSNEKLPFQEVQDVELKETMELAAWNHGSARILIAGSDSMGTEEEGLAEQVSKRLEEAYGDAVKVKHLQYDGNSIDFLAENKVEDYVDFKPDVFIYEPLLLNSNGIEDAVMTTNDMIDTVLEALQAENEGLYTIVTPPNPIYGATYYPREVDDLKEYAEKQDITYVDHWNAWPDHQSVEVKNYLNDAQSAPNEEGVKIWADEILKSFGL